MPTLTLSTALCALLLSAKAYPVRRDDVYHGIGLYFVTNIPGQRHQESPSPIEINKLAEITGGKASGIRFDSVEVNVNLGKVECRAFSDCDGVVPLGEPFHAEDPVILSTTEVVSVGSILCYVVTDEEAAAAAF